MTNQLNKTIEQLENDYWSSPEYGSHVVTRCHELRKIPLSQLDIEGLRLLISQQIGLPYVVPLALQELAVNPWVSGDFYEGDLLNALLNLPSDFWLTHCDLVDEMQMVINQLSDMANKIENDILPKWQAKFG